MISKFIESYCCEDISKIENYEQAINDPHKMWHCHHRLETHNSDGERRLVEISYKELKALGMYFNRPASEFIFLTAKEHKSLHNKGKHHSEETKKKLSEINKGKLHSKEEKKKISEALKGRTSGMKGKCHSKETKKKMSESMKGKNRGPKSEETKKKLSEAIKGKHWKLVDGKRVWY